MIGFVCLESLHIYLLYFPIGEIDKYLAYKDRELPLIGYSAILPSLHERHRRTTYPSNAQRNPIPTDCDAEKNHGFAPNVYQLDEMDE